MIKNHNPDPLNSSRCPAIYIVGAMLFIAMGVVAAFIPALSNGLVNWDDDYLLVYNNRYQSIDADSLRWMFTTGFAGHYQPLTWLSYAVDYQLWGFSAFGFHLTNLVLHVATAIGLLCVSLRLFYLTANTPGWSSLLGATLAAMLFAVHPLRVESVAWATERRDVLSGALLMVAVYGYLRSLDAQRPMTSRWFAVAVVAFVLSLLSKAAGMTLAVVLLIMDIYPLRRWPTATLRQLLLEKLWFLVPGVVVMLVAAWAQRSAGAMWSLDAHPLSLRIAQMGYSIIYYPYKSLVPFPLLPLYEQPTDTTPLDAVYVISWAAVLGVTGMLLLVSRRHPAPLIAWVCYLVLISPVVGLAQSGPQLVADRYSYIACMPFVILIGSVLLVDRKRHGVYTNKQLLAYGFLMIVLGVMVNYSRGLTAVWRDSRTLWEYTLRHAPHTGTAHLNLASWLLSMANDEQTESERNLLLGKTLHHAEEARDILPGNRTAHLLAAQALYELQRYEEAIATCELARMLFPVDAQLLVVQGVSHQAADQTENAEAAYREVLSHDPQHEEAALRLIALLHDEGRHRAELQVLNDVLHHHAGHRGFVARKVWLLATSADDGVYDPPQARSIIESMATEPQALTGPLQEAYAAALAGTGDTQRAAAIARSLLAAETLPPAEIVDRVRQALTSYERGEAYRE